MHNENTFRSTSRIYHSTLPELSRRCIWLHGCCILPFVRVEKGEPRRTDITRLQQALTLGIDIIPQVVFKDVDEFVTLTYTIKNLGFQHIDLNLGCPYPMQTHRGRGAAMIGNIEVMTQVVKLIESDTDTAYSIKMRLGLADPTQWHMLMPVLNSIPLHHITVHPRIATQMYEGDIDHEQFSHIAAESKNPVVLNGDIRSLSDIEQIRENFPTTQAAMIGQGLLARPSLAAEWKEGRDWTKTERFEALHRFHTALFEGYSSSLCGDVQILRHLKPIWEYLEARNWTQSLQSNQKSNQLNKILICSPFCVVRQLISTKKMLNS